MASKKLQKQTKYWVEKGVITEKQAESILSDPYEAQLVISNNTFALLATIGSILAGIGVVFIIAANWDSIGRLVKLGISISSMLAFYAAGYYARFKKEMPRTGNALFFIGAVLYGSTIFLIGQIYNIQSQFSKGYLLWFLGIIPLVYLLRSRATAILAVAVSIAFILTALETEISGEVFFIGSQAIVYLLIAGSVLWMAVAFWHSKFNKTKYLTSPYQITALVFWATPSLFLSTRFAYYAPGEAGKLLHSLMIISLLACISLPIFDWVKKKLDATTLIPLLFLGATVVLVYLQRFSGLKQSVFFSGKPVVTPTYIVNNFVLFIALLLVIIIAHKQRTPLLAYAVSVLFSIGILVRYFELSFDYFSGQFGIVLLGAGILLLALGGIIEFQRRRFKNA